MRASGTGHVPTEFWSSFEWRVGWDGQWCFFFFPFQRIVTNRSFVLVQILWLVLFFSSTRSGVAGA